MSQAKILRVSRKKRRKEVLIKNGKEVISQPTIIEPIIESQKKSNIPIKPLTVSQKQLMNSIKTKTMVVEFGPAGTGKTYISAGMAADMLADKEIEKIIITRPNVPAGESIGFFPGTLEEKMAPWVAPISSVMKERLGESFYEYLLKKKRIEIVPLEVIRGRDFSNCFVIVDEAQNLSFHEMKTVITRIGRNSKVVINGDIRQSDLKQESGLKRYLEILSRNYDRLSEFVDVVEFSSDDIVRSELVKAHIKIFEEENL